MCSGSDTLQFKPQGSMLERQREQEEKHVEFFNYFVLVVFPNEVKCNATVWKPLWLRFLRRSNKKVYIIHDDFCFDSAVPFTLISIMCTLVNEGSHDRVVS